MMRRTDLNVETGFQFDEVKVLLELANSVAVCDGADNRLSDGEMERVRVNDVLVLHRDDCSVNQDLSCVINCGGDCLFEVRHVFCSLIGGAWWEAIACAGHGGAVFPKWWKQSHCGLVSQGVVR